MIIKKCVICGFTGGIESHHLIKFDEYGADNTDNQVWLCPNHHWIADFGNKTDKDLLLSQIKELTEKEGMIDYIKRNYFDKIIRTLLEDRFNKKFNEAEWNDRKNEAEYRFYRKILLSRNGVTSKEKYELIERAEIIYLIRMLSDKLNKK